MCGIIGVATRGPAERWEQAITHALDAVDHRGPDARGVRAIAGQGATCVLGHTRLRIIDLSPEADQPMPNEDGTVWLAYNGELYNHPELRRELQHAGHEFRSSCDTEVLVHLYEQMDGDLIGMLRRLRGMFAFALFDTSRGRLVLARDRLGIKPMYCADIPGGLAFASEARALVRAGAVPGAPDERSLGAYLVWGRMSGEQTLLRGVRALMPGSFLEWGPGGSHIGSWFRPEVRPAPDVAADGVRLLRAALDDAVSRHLIADRPVGVFLSGGVDSGAVIRAAARGGPVRALTVTFPEAEPHEGPAAARLAADLGAEHVEIAVKGPEVAEALPRIIGSMDQPTADGVNTWLVSRAARESGLVVALSGLGGDELFGGYPSFRLVPKLARAGAFLGVVPRSVRSAAAGAISRRSPSGSRAVRIMGSRVGYRGAYSAVRQLFALQELRAFGVRIPLPADEGSPGPDGEPTDRVMLLETENYLPNQLLRDTDQMSMAHSLEVRVPLLDDSVVRVALALPASVRTAAGKRILVAAAGGPLVAKRPFALPFDAWLRGPLHEPVREALLSEDLPFATEVPPGFRRHVWRNFEEGRTHWSRPWSLAVLRLWPGANDLRW